MIALDSIEMVNLENVKEMIEDGMKGEKIFYEIENVWLDYGAKIMHTTIVAYPHEGMSWQIFSPKQLREIKLGTFTKEDVDKVIEQNKRMIR